MALTRYPTGSIRELLCLAVPLMFSSLSVTCMIFLDRLFLAHHSTASLHAVTNATNLGWVYLMGWIVMAGISEIFVAQYNNATYQQEIGKPVWQMIWLSLLSSLFFFPIALNMDNWFFQSSQDHLEYTYLQWMFWFGPTLPLYAALCSFFVGRGKTYIVTRIAVIANVLNACLDYILIFGQEGWIDSLGIKGAAISTTISSVSQVLILGMIFLKRSNREQFGTHHYSLNPTLMWQCIKIGFPKAVFISIELMGWALFYQMMANLGEHHLTVASIYQSLLILLYFFAESVGRATAAITGNLIGDKQNSQISSTVYSGIYLHLIFFIALLVSYCFFKDQISLYFLPHASKEQLISLNNSLGFCLLIMCFYLLLDGIRLMFAGVLTAAGDTLFLLLAGTFAIWLLLIGPVYYWVIKEQASVEKAYLISIFYILSATLIYFWRYKVTKSKLKRLSSI